ncbi:hypothetical protein DMS21_15345, partial [Klebsiella variicola]
MQVISQEEMIESVEDGDRIIIDQDGNASVNFKSNEDEISSGNLSLVHDPHFDGGKLMLSDELGFSVPAT